MFTEPVRKPRRPSLTPMIDVVFLLLVFFMLASRFGSEEALPLPLAGGGGTWSGPPRLVEIPADLPPGADGQSFADTAPPHVSIINLASVRDLGTRMGADLDARRFRGNLIIEAEPWAEFDWIGKTIAVGDVRLDIVSRIERCAATTVNPQTGERDQQVPLALRKNYGHADCGVYAIVRCDGMVRAGAEISEYRE